MEGVRPSRALGPLAQRPGAARAQARDVLDGDEAAGAATRPCPPEPACGAVPGHQPVRPHPARADDRAQGAWGTRASSTPAPRVAVRGPTLIRPRCGGEGTCWTRWTAYPMTSDWFSCTCTRSTWPRTSWASSRPSSGAACARPTTCSARSETGSFAASADATTLVLSDHGMSVPDAPGRAFPSSPRTRRSPSGSSSRSTQRWSRLWYLDDDEALRRELRERVASRFAGRFLTPEDLPGTTSSSRTGSTATRSSCSRPGTAIFPNFHSFIKPKAMHAYAPEDRDQWGIFIGPDRRGGARLGPRRPDRGDRRSSATRSIPFGG